MYSNNILPPQDQSRAYEFAKNRRQQLQQPINNNRLKQIDEELSYWKQRLLTAAAQAREPIVDRLLKLRAEQTTIILGSLYSNEGRSTDRKAQKIIARYYRDCHNLLKAVEKS